MIFKYHNLNLSFWNLLMKLRKLSKQTLHISGETFHSDIYVAKCKFDMFKIPPVLTLFPWRRLLLNKSFGIDCSIEIIRLHANGMIT